jgi:hypothetical protein
MSEDPGEESKPKMEAIAEDPKAFPYLASLNPAQLKGKSPTSLTWLRLQLSSPHPTPHYKS